MGREIERKFLVKNNEFKQLSKGVLYKQGYLSSNFERTVRVRVSNGKGHITIKGTSKGAVRPEYEYQIPVDEANEIIDSLCEKPIIEKFRYKYTYQGFTWEIDEFLGENEGLVIAEIELETEDTVFTKPEWIGEEVTEDVRYFNSNLVKMPYKCWKDEYTTKSPIDI